MSAITRYRGDTAADRFTIKQDGVIVDLTGASFKMTVNSDENPVDTTNQLFSLTGVVSAPATGVVEFSPSALEADQMPGDYYYDVQMTDASGGIRTIKKGRYRIKQDITKG